MGVLENHGDFPAPNLSHVLLGALKDVLPVQHNRTVDDAGGWLRIEPHEGEGCHGLAAARLADDAEGFPLPEGEADAVHSLHRSPTVEEVGMQILNFQNNLVPYLSCQFMSPA